MPKFILFVFLCFISFSLKAQTWELGGGVGGAGYMGDLNISNPVKVSGISIGAFVKRNFDGYLSAKLNYTYGIISAADANSSSVQFEQRNLSFTTALSEVGVIGEFNFFEYIPQIGKNIFTPYVFLGVAALTFSPSTVYQGQKYDLSTMATEGQKKPYATTAFSIPYGAGIKYNITGKFTLGFELGYRNPNTDYLDDVSGNYFYSGHNTISEKLSDRSGEKSGVYIGSPGSQRGDGQPRDTYFFTQVTIAFTFLTQKCYYH